MDILYITNMKNNREEKGLWAEISREHMIDDRTGNNGGIGKTQMITQPVYAASEVSSSRTTTIRAGDRIRRGH